MLKPKGLLYVAEVKSRMARAEDDFAAMLESMGFELEKKLGGNQMFVLFVFKNTNRKVAALGDEDKLELRPCQYKKR